MPSHAVGDAFYGGVVGITYSVSRHPLLSWKASEQPLVGIVINVLTFPDFTRHFFSSLTETVDGFVRVVLIL